MRLKREGDLLTLTLNATESRLVLFVFEQLAASYRLKPGELDDRTASVWYSTRGCQSARATPEETAEWLEHLHAFKSSRLEKLEEWSAQLSGSKPGTGRLNITVTDAPAFISTVNDYRLMMAARNSIGEADMGIDSPFELIRLPDPRRKALMEIHFLAWLIEEALRALED